MTIYAAADGSALGNPGPAGWGWYVDADRWACGGWDNGTNNMGELMAVLDLLQQSAHLDEPLHIYCDSTYVINSITKWMPGWKRKGWKKGDGKPVLNIELMKALDAAMAGRDVKFEWVKGHAGHELNEEADRLATMAAATFRDGVPLDGGPGFAGSSTSHPADLKPSVPGAGEPEPDLFSEIYWATNDAAALDSAADPSDPAASDHEQVIALERSLLTDEVRGDPAAVEDLLHPQWQEIGRSGRLWEREEMVALIAPLDVPTTLEVVSVSTLTEGVILLVWRSDDPSSSDLRSSVWVRERGGWVQRFHQGTPTAG